MRYGGVGWLHGARIAIAVGFDGFERAQRRLWLGTYYVLLLAGSLAVLLYGINLVSTGQTPDPLGGVSSSLTTGFLIGVVTGEVVNRPLHNTKIERV